MLFSRWRLAISASATRSLRAALCLLAAISPIAVEASEWVIGDVSIVEDYRAVSPQQAILITLKNKTYYSGGAAATVCTQRFRVAVGQENVDADIQKGIFAIVLAARLSGEKVRLFVNPNNVLSGGYCAVQIASIGEIPLS